MVYASDDPDRLVPLRLQCPFYCCIQHRKWWIDEFKSRRTVQKYGGGQIEDVLYLPYFDLFPSIEELDASIPPVLSNETSANVTLHLEAPPNNRLSARRANPWGSKRWSKSRVHAIVTARAVRWRVSMCWCTRQRRGIMPSSLRGSRIGVKMQWAGGPLAISLSAVNASWCSDSWSLTSPAAASWRPFSWRSRSQHNSKLGDGVLVRISRSKGDFSPEVCQMQKASKGTDHFFLSKEWKHCFVV